MNVNVSYNGFSLADAASCVMMRLPVPDLVWDMEALWKVWNEPLPGVDVPEVLPEPLPEVPAVKSKKPVGCRRAVTYAGKEYPDVKSLAEAYHLNYKTCFARLRDGVPLDAPINRHPLPYRGKPVTIDGTAGRACPHRERGEVAVSYKKNAEGLFIGKTVTYRGVTYPSVVALARAYGLKRDTCWRRYLKGLPLDMPFHAKGAVTYDGKTYASMIALAVAFGITPQLCSARLIRGIPLDRPVCSGGCKPCEYGGERYESIADFARRLGLNIGSARLLIETSGRWL